MRGMLSILLTILLNEKRGWYRLNVLATLTLRRGGLNTFGSALGLVAELLFALKNFHKFLTYRKRAIINNITRILTIY